MLFDAQVYFLSPAGWFCVTLRRETELGGPGEESVLLDTGGISHKHPHLLSVEKNALANTAT